MTPVETRPATAADLPAVEALVARAYAPHEARMGVKPGPMTSDYRALIEDGRVEVATLEGGVAGLLVLLPQADALLLDTVAVDPARQGAGLGRALVARAETAAREAGFGRVRLYTHVAMTGNQALYRRLGYRETARRREKGFDRVYFEKVVA